MSIRRRANSSTIGMIVTFGLGISLAIVGYGILINNSATADDVRNSKLIIDTDAGADDAVAILMAVVASDVGDGPQVVGITCVNGNTYVDNVVLNVLKTLNVVDRLDIPVYKGAAQPLMAMDRKTNYFGTDGFGDFDYPDPPSKELLNNTHAVVAMIEVVKNYPGEVTLLALGPLTNVALAIRLYPSFLNDLRQLIVMGGSVEGIGNMRNGVEYNFEVDPEANYIVFNASESKPLVLVPYETTLRANTTMAFRMSWDETNNSKVWLLNSAESNRLNTTEEYWYCADAVAAAVAITSGDITTRSSYWYGDAIHEGSITKGMIILDYGNVMSRNANTYLIQDIDTSSYKDMLTKYLTTQINSL